MRTPLPELPSPWHLENIDLTKQLHRELSEKHVLFGVPMKTIGRRQDNDDVLFELENQKHQFVVVHLTWSSHTIADPTYPAIRFYKDWEDLYENRLLPDSRDFDVGNDAQGE